MEKGTKVNNEILSEDSQGGIPKPLVPFRGSYEHNLDEKGRISIPSSFRTSLADANQNNLVLTNYVCDGARCLDGFCLSDWDDFENRLRKKSRFDSKLRKLENFYLARAAQCSIDSSGRINIPAHLRNYAGLKKEVVFTSSVYGFRVWDKRVWDMIFKESETELLENPDLFTDVDL